MRKRAHGRAPHVLTGNLPERLPSGMMDLRLGGNLLSGSIPAAYGACVRARALCERLRCANARRRAVPSRRATMHGVCSVAAPSTLPPSLSALHPATADARDLRALELGTNLLTGPLPAGACECERACVRAVAGRKNRRTHV